MSDDNGRQQKEIDPEQIRVESAADRRERYRQIAATKERITIRIDADILARFRELAADSGGSYQSLMNRALAEWLEGDRVEKSFSRALEGFRKELEASMRAEFERRNEEAS